MRIPGIPRVTLRCLAATLDVGIFLAAFRGLTPLVETVRDVFPGALLSGLAFFVLQQLSASIVSHYLQNAQSTYGHFATVITILWWFCIKSLITLLGAQASSPHTAPSTSQTITGATRTAARRNRPFHFRPGYAGPTVPGHATASLFEAAAHLSKADALTFATVNATILGLLFALSTAVGVIWLQTIDGLNRALFDKAHEANGLKRPMKWQLNDYSAADLSSDELVEMMRVIVTGEDFSEEGFAPPSAVAARGLLLVHCFGVIADRYPFAASGPPDRHTHLAFATRDEVTTWLEGLKESARRCEVLLRVGSLKMRELATAGVGDQLAKVGGAAPDLIPMPVDDFARFMSEISQIATQTEALVGQLARYRSRLPARASIVTAAVVSSVVFVSGIVYPMIANRPWSPPVSWLPGAFYTTLLLAGCIFIFRRYRPRRREVRR